MMGLQNEIMSENLVPCSIPRLLIIVVDHIFPLTWLFQTYPNVILTVVYPIYHIHIPSISPLSPHYMPIIFDFTSQLLDNPYWILCMCP